MFLTQDEYLDFGFKQTDDFYRLLDRAIHVLHSVTRSFYIKI